jgi:biopolymer transport protein ExbB/TolQ
VSRPASRISFLSVLPTVGWPIVLGLGLTAGFFALMYQGPLNLPLVHRYFAGHPINMVETAFFFIGLVALNLKLIDVLGQNSSLDGITLGESGTLQPASKATEMLDALANLPARLRASYLGRRLTEALGAVERKGSADGLDEELKYLSDLDAGRQQDSYALVRIIVWATPMLGFLGTVVGITDALGDLSRQDMRNLQGAMQGLLSGLYVAFDTTAIALCFSMVLMFIQFGIDRMETQLMSAVDDRALQELLGRFEVVGTSSDPQVATMQRIGHAVLQASEQLVKRQVDLWQASMDAAQQQWQQVTKGTGEHLQTTMTSALDRSLSAHAAQLAENARVLGAQQQELVRQGELMTQAIKAAGDVVQLERALNQNLSALAGAKNFEDTVMSLAAAIHLLNVRLGKTDAQQVDLKGYPPKGRAA